MNEKQMAEFAVEMVPRTIGEAVLALLAQKAPQIDAAALTDWLLARQALHARGTPPWLAYTAAVERLAPDVAPAE